MTSSSGVRLDLATIISTSAECILYGISLVMCGGSIWALIRGRPRNEINLPLVLVAVVLTIFSTIHMTVDIQRLVDGFITEGGTFPGGPIAFFADVTQRTFVIKNVVCVLQTLLGDAVVIFHCYVVWQSSTVVVLPMVLWCTASLSSVAFFYHMSHAKMSGDYFQRNLGRWIVTFNVLSMTTNTLSSVLLAYRIWAVNQDNPGVVRILSRSGVESKLLLRILVDAALLYTFTLLTFLLCYAFRNTAQFIVLDMITPIVSITFYMVLVRVAIAKNDSARVSPTLLSPLRFAVRAPSPPESTTTVNRRSSI